MRLNKLAMIMVLLSAPMTAMAQEDKSDLEQGVDLLSQGMRLLLDGLGDEIEPQMQALSDTIREWGLLDLEIDDFSNYQAPEILPNGDIIIRRKNSPTGSEIEI